VHQEDLFFATLTVREHLTFHARVRMRRGKRGQSTLERVDHVLNSVGLAKCQDTLIGGPHSLIRGGCLILLPCRAASLRPHRGPCVCVGTTGISGGERKRLSVATELLSDPDIIFADEPTSGLDAHMALSVCRILQELSFKGKVVVCAIHQPSSEIFELYSHLMLLSKGE
jgi:ABC-type multidrug transport system ATPase subunit